MYIYIYIYIIFMYCQLEDISLLATLKFEYKKRFMLCYVMLYQFS